ncbi:DUF5808 domain-containing protein [Amycolatopsis cihanbeyliensis]|uniref:DUF5808 domain-containing protein n=1 Tax=Amycolatopsis cihanbeyliensis TaxID=1128664 RepID=UPI001FE294B0|nr:DUF5808 domain-containing protein [Amycolatopsis cihanbeyliensis]
MFEPVLLQAAITVLLPLVALVALRARPDLDAARPTGSARRYRIYLRGIARQVLLLAGAFNLGLGVSALRLWEITPPSTFWAVAAYVPLVAAIVGWVLWERRVGQAGHRLPAERGEEEEDAGVVQRDDDRNWFLAGMVYVSRRDPALLVHRRVGTYWTLNLGHPVAWLLLAGLAAFALLAVSGIVAFPSGTTCSSEHPGRHRCAEVGWPR